MTAIHKPQLTEKVGGKRRVHLLAPEGAAGVAVLAVLLARRRRLPDDLLHLEKRAICISDHATYCRSPDRERHLLELLGVHVSVAVEVEHAEGDFELPPEGRTG